VCKKLHFSALLLGHRQVVQDCEETITGIGYYVGDEILSYITVLGVKEGYQHIYVCVSVIWDTCVFNF